MERSAPNRIFRDRREAGAALGAALRPLAADRPIVLALPRGGVPVGYEIALALQAPLDVLLVRKVGAPGNPELGIGAIAEGGVRVLDRGTIRALMISVEELERSLERAAAELAGQLDRYRRGRPSIELGGRTVIVVDDGLATGGTAHAAVRAARQRGAARVVLAVPVGSQQAVELLRGEADDVVCLEAPPDFRAVGAWYRTFGQTSDAEVGELLERAAAALATVSSSAAPAGDPPAQDPDVRSVEIPAPGGVLLPGDLQRPADARGLVIFAHGSGSSRHSPRNRQVAAALGRAGLATLLIDLLTPAEERDRRNVFDIELLARRLTAATAWAAEQPELSALAIGYFGASTGGGAALWAAAEADGAGARGRLTRRAPRPGLRGAGPRARPGPADRRRRGSRGARPQPRSARQAERRVAAGGRSRRHASLRGARRARRRGSARRRLVRHEPGRRRRLSGRRA